ncbi:MAG: dynamin family protein [Stigonema ocellatum SAG 48.90 = DSM 106950]|nr:dynamin family protein [Stigonema ocellatum SAG 48.90 = DSM 106950]
MSIDRDLLKQLEAQPAPDQSGVEGLVHSIHRTPDLREWVTLESTVLPPVPINRGSYWGLMSLLAVHTRLEDGSEGLIAPWGAVEWKWDDKSVAQKIDLRQHSETASLRSSRTIAARPADTNVSLEPIEHAVRLRSLFQALDTLLSTPPTDAVNLTPLAEHYVGLMPAAVYPYYWALIPASRQWLQSDVPSVTLLKPVQQDEQGDSTHILSPHPTDVSKRIDPWLRQSLSLAESFSLKEVVAELQALEARWHLPGFRLAIVGEFSRGKSTFINRLLGQELLPIGVLPTTAALTSIIAGSKDQMEVYTGEGSGVQMRSLEESSWDDLLAINPNGQEQQVLAKVRLTLNQPWLQANDIELIDTPGAGDLSDYRATLVFDLLSQCDAAVLLVSATIPFSMTEAAFLEQEVIGRHVPRILVVVSKLDTIPESEREGMMSVIRHRVAQVSAAIPVLPLHSADGLEAVRSQIEVMVAKGDRQAWRSRQVAAQLAAVLSHMVEIGEAGIASAQMSDAELEQAMRKAAQEVREAQNHWEGIRLELDRRRIQYNQMFQKRIIAEKTDLLELLDLELSRTPNPKVWWERELNFRLRHELLAQARKAEGFLVQVMAGDFEWLQTEVSHRFGINMSQKAGEAKEILGIDYNLNQMQLADIQRYRLLTRVGSSAAMIGSYVLGGPAAMAIALSLGTGLFSEKLLNDNLEDQRRTIAKELENSVERAIEEYCGRVFERLRQLYNQLIEDTKREQAAWSSGKTTAVQMSAHQPDQTNWQQLIAQASAKRKEILS